MESVYDEKNLSETTAAKTTATQESNSLSAPHRCFEYDYIYEQTPEGALSTPELKSYATAIGLDTNLFESCLDSGQYHDYVQRDRQAAFAAGARGTPTFLINGQPVYFYDS